MKRFRCVLADGSISVTDRDFALCDQAPCHSPLYPEGPAFIGDLVILASEIVACVAYKALKSHHTTLYFGKNMKDLPILFRDQPGKACSHDKIS